MRHAVPVRDGIVSFLEAQPLSEQDHRERAMRDDESSWYDPMFAGYTNAVEVPSVLRRIGRPTGPILDVGCGTGRITEALTELGQPIVTVDYSEACLRLMLRRTAGSPVREAGDRLLDFMVRRGHKADFVLERTPLAGALGFFWLAKVRAPTATRS